MSSYTRWFKRTAIIAPFGLIVGMSAFYAYANWKGQQDLNNHFSRLKKLGYEQNPKAFFSPKIPPEQDAYQDPEMLKEFKKSDNEKITFKLNRKFDRLAPKLQVPQIESVS